MNILIIAPFMPYPLSQGGKIRVFNIIKYLSRSHHVSLACLNDHAVEDCGPLRNYCEEVLCVERAPNIIRDFPRFLFGQEPLNYVRYSSVTFRDALKSIVQRKRFDLVQIEFSTMWQYADVFNGIPVVLDAHNVEYDIISQVKKFYKNPLRRLLYSLEEKKLREKEKVAWKECDICFAVSEAERETITSSLGRTEKVLAIPNGVDLERFEYIPNHDAADRRLLFLGGMDYQPNLDAALYLLGDIMPGMRSNLPNVTLDMVGRELWRIPDRQHLNTIFHENVPEVIPFFRQADVLVVPLRYGAGTRVKILEAMASGLPVVTTSKGCEGLEVRHEEHLLIADSPEKFGRAVKRLIEESETRAAISRNARNLVEDRYSWKALVGDMAKSYAVCSKS